MRPHLPPLNALKAFEAAARHESFTRAAEELCVTQGAVSHQVKALETELAIKLFNRERQRLIITEAGRDYLAVVRDALDRIAAGTERLLQRQSAGVLTVSTSPDSPPNGWCTGSAILRRPIPALISGSRPRCITSILPAKRSTLRCATAMAIGRVSMP
ncbi:LysR family transcriptional regulator [Bradyrhizobium sp. ISRA442]|uniref:LysR family transcriptional regulator n=1 Tax=Bradyrhizobium sp. ISRA442 TaxID=2866197 RepID=UPI00311ABB47